MSVTVRTAGLPLDLVMATLLTRDDWQDIGEVARVRIVERTRRGIGPDGQNWPAYSPSYARRKAVALGAGPVNLTVSGAMLNGIRVKEASATHVVLGW